MGETIDDHALAELLPGTWTVAATNFPMWLSGQRREPQFSYDLISADPLVLGDDVRYLTAEGQEKHILGQDRWAKDEFVWRGKGRLRFFASRWQVSGMSEDGTVATLHFSKSFATPAGVDVIVREGVHHPELRAMIAHSTERFGLSPEEFGSLTWLAAGPTD